VSGYALQALLPLTPPIQIATSVLLLLKSSSGGSREGAMIG
jgi:hypothetical protein